MKQSLPVSEEVNFVIDKEQELSQDISRNDIVQTNVKQVELMDNTESITVTKDAPSNGDNVVLDHLKYKQGSTQEHSDLKVSKPNYDSQEGFSLGYKRKFKELNNVKRGVTENSEISGF